jgi:5-methylthioadenosine/S-adenosylhomocysteine deaminase
VTDDSVEETVDLLVVNGDVITMDDRRRVLLGAAIAVSAGRVVAIGSTERLRARWPEAPIHDAGGGVVHPGLINAHQHLTGYPLFRSAIPDDTPSGESITKWAVPLLALVTGDDDELAAALSAADCVLNGITTVVDAGTTAFVSRAAMGVTSVGIRAFVGEWGWDTEGLPFAAPADEVLDRQRAVLDAFAPDEPVTGSITLVGHDYFSDELVVGAADLARARNAPMTMHMSPTRNDTDNYFERHRCRPVEYLDRLGVLGPHLLLAHLAWLGDTELDALVATDTAVAYCPWCYLHSGSGITGHGRHAEMVGRGVRVGLGCDATTSGDQIDILRAAALAAGLAKETSPEPDRFGAHEALEMATIEGARAIGCGHDRGSIEVGKWADIVIHDPVTSHWQPRSDLVHQLVWSTDGRTVRDVFVGGRLVVSDHRCTTVDLTELLAHAAVAGPALLARTGLEVPHRWPHVAAQ